MSAGTYTWNYRYNHGLQGYVLSIHDGNEELLFLWGEEADEMLAALAKTRDEQQRQAIIAAWDPRPRREE